MRPSCKNPITHVTVNIRRSSGQAERLSIMLNDGGTNPDNYDWKSKGNRVMCFDKSGHMIFNVLIPKTMREALLNGYLEGWAYGDAINQNYIEMLEGLCAERLPQPMTFDDAEMNALQEVFERELLGPEDYDQHVMNWTDDLWGGFPNTDKKKIILKASESFFDPQSDFQSEKIGVLLSDEHVLEWDVSQDLMEQLIEQLQAEAVENPDFDFANVVELKLFKKVLGDQLSH